MRSLWQSLPADVRRAVVLVCAADAVVGAAFGALTVGAGLPLWLPVALSLAVFAGAAQFLFVGVIAAGGTPLSAVAAGLLVNARLVPLGLAVGDLLGPGWLRRLAGAHLLVDETVAFTLAQGTAGARRAAYWTCGAALFVCWNLGVLAGAFGGALAPDTADLGLDAAFPAVLLALVLPTLADGATRRAALVGAVIAVATALVLPAGVPVLLALLGVLAALPGRRPPQTTQGGFP
ncbi:AzlC family ABC transporter permease [Geodermatophilus sp. DSM 44513]|uniref:AzlC family ABC transporter permease n=1 Tax=Geodermatophilus sp. DSM 44513 TaxID=1528104 RepID=UPI00127E1C0C|nr:AzlC family ABC transporter permease [Geodermatophilus sp. DSM 44513]WNV74299.1 AzlC family ABC transporter permease [Geodermatophilus sp. DSM 44513]